MARLGNDGEALASFGGQSPSGAPTAARCDRRLSRNASVAQKKVEFTTCWVQNGLMKTSVDLDDELAAEVRNAVSLTREKPATVLRMAIRAGLPAVTSRFQAPRPEGYFADAYRNYPKERLEFEQAMAKGTAQKPER